MIFNRTTAYSISVLGFMAGKSDSRFSASDLNRELHIPYSYLRTVMGDLSKHGLVESVKGRNGGFRLTRPPGEVTLAEVVHVTEGIEGFSQCIMGLTECPFNHGCMMHPLWVRMRGDLLRVLRETSLADMLNNGDSFSL